MRGVDAITNRSLAPKLILLQLSAGNIDLDSGDDLLSQSLPLCGVVTRDADHAEHVAGRTDSSSRWASLTREVVSLDADWLEVVVVEFLVLGLLLSGKVLQEEGTLARLWFADGSTMGGHAEGSLSQLRLLGDTSLRLLDDLGGLGLGELQESALAWSAISRTVHSANGADGIVTNIVVLTRGAVLLILDDRLLVRGVLLVVLV